MEKAVLIADPKSNSWEFAQKIQKYIKEKKESDIALEEVSISLFRNGEINMHVPKSIRKRDIYFVQDSNKNPQQWWVESVLFRDLALGASAETLTFIFPHHLYDRQDRKHIEHVPISARAFAKSIQTGAKRIIAMDLHALQIQGFYDIPVDTLPSFHEATPYFVNNYKDKLENLVIVSPDVGGVKRARKFRDYLEKYGIKATLAIMDKDRPKPGEVGEMTLVGDVSGKNALMIDDMVDSGGTLNEASKVLKSKKNGALEVYAYATHGLFTEGIDELKNNLDLIVVSNTHKISYPEVKIVDVTPTFAEAIYRAQKGLSISKLFE